MDSTRTAGTSPGSGLAQGWLGRSFDAIPLSPLATSCSLAALLLGLFAATELATGRFGELPGVELLEHLGRDVRIAVVNILMLSYLVGANRSLRLYTRRTISGLASLLRLSQTEEVEVARQACAPPGIPARVAVSSGIVICVLLSGIASPGFSLLLDERYWKAETAWHWATLFPIGVLAGWLAAASLRAAAVLSNLARARLEPELLDPRPLAPFVRQGLHTALLWLGLVAVASFLLLDERFGLVLLLLLVLASVMSALALLASLRGVRDRVRERKLEELGWVRARLADEREQLGRAGEAADRAASRIPGLLAWESRIGDVSEWPLDPPTLLRFGLYLGIPLGSWVGGALVERLLSSLWGSS
jgi:hypothetical protein